MSGTDRKTDVTDPVAEVMAWPVATVHTDATLAEVIEALAADEIGTLGVLSGDHLVGVVSERDLVTHLAQGANPDHVTAGEAMTGDLVVAAPTDSVVDAATRMREAGVRHLPVIRQGTLVGFLSERDLLGVLLDAVTGTATSPR